jgi:hypothetical protein
MSDQRVKLRRIVMAICGRKGLALSEEQRRDIQRDVIGVASLTQMTADQLEKLVAHLRRLQQASGAPATGTGSTAEWRFVFRLTPERQIYGQKIYRMAQRIGKLLTPPVPVAPKAYIEGITEHMRGTRQPLEFCDCPQLLKVIQALEIFAERKGV